MSIFFCVFRKIVDVEETQILETTEIIKEKTEEVLYKYEIFIRILSAQFMFD